MIDGKTIYEFGDFRLDTAKETLQRDGLNIPITRKTFETLNVLVENADRLVEKQELMQTIWHDRFVEESNLTFNIKMLRKALGDSASSPTYIETIPRRGYRFIAEVKQCNGGTNGGSVIESSENPVRLSGADVSPIRDRSYILAVSLVVVVIGSLGLMAWIWNNNANAASAPILSAGFNSTRLSETGKVGHAAISPDGQYLAYTNQVGSKYTLWLRHIETSNNTQISSASEENYYGLAFSNDSQSLFFSRKSPNFAEPLAIYRIPLTGGVPTKIADRAQGWISVSPDDKQIAFVRYEEGVSESNKLMIIGEDGNNEREILTSVAPNAFWAHDFAPDGKTIAAVYGHSRNASQQMGLVEIDVVSGAMVELNPTKFFHIDDVEWLPDKSGLIFTANESINDKSKIWILDYETRNISAVTKDSVDYAALSLTADAQKLVATTVAADFHLYLENTAEPKDFRSLTQARDKFGFTPDGRIVYATDTAGNEDIWLMNADGANQRQLTTEKSLDFAPLVSPDNRYIFFTSNRSGQSQVWRMSLDGSDQIQITQKEGGYPRFVSPDGGWLYYQAAFSNKLWRIPTGGGEEMLFDDNYGYYQAFSPNGDLLAYLYRDKDTKKIRINILSTGDNKIRKTFDTPTTDSGFAYFLRWRDSSTLAYTVDEDSLPDMLWEQDLSGAQPRLRSELGNEEIMDMQYSPDGKRFAIIRGSWNHDAVLLSGLK